MNEKLGNSEAFANSKAFGNSEVFANSEAFLNSEASWIPRVSSASDLELIKRRYEVSRARYSKRILVCAGTGCVANGSLEVYSRFRDELKLRTDGGQSGRDDTGVCLRSDISGCHGFCQMGPLVRVEPDGILYTRVSASDVPEILEATIEGRVVERLLYVNPRTGERHIKEDEIPFYRHQKRVTLADCGRINPEDIREYIAVGGYKALTLALAMSQDDVCSIVEASGLRGRGGGGFPTGKKWRFAKKAPGDQKYVVCNGDEGDPGAFMDRSLMEGDPHRVLEGMMIAGYAIGASKGFVYVRAEYPLAVRRIRKAIKDAKAAGLLGERILGSDFSFDVEVREGAGAFVCGEETALLASIEGRRGMPRPRPPFPAQEGLFGCPTLINNVETLGAIAPIILNGADWFRGLGVPNSPGTKTFALTGEVVNTGLIEVPMGTTLKHIIFDIGGGIRNDRRFKAVQIGGPSGGCLTEEHLDLPLDYDSLAAVGAMVGSGGLVVMNEDTCIVEVARFFMNFTQNESCGKCVLCREGTKRMLQILERIVHNKGKEEDLELLEELAKAVKAGSLCGLGKTAPNPVLTTLKYFKDEYLAHVRDKRCPAGVCEGFKAFRIDPDKCKGCGRCARSCPVSAISGKIKSPFAIDQEKCVKCGVCQSECKFDAVLEVA
ncbi:MAG TPA: 4Fe-4S binding protein [Clostridia bacterium]|nr:4Fe-4S binding protein [Clostridia bacterium]